MADPNEQDVPIENLLPLEAGEHIALVQSLIRPGPNPISQELDQPYHEPVDRGDGHTVFRATERTERDEFNSKLRAAAETVTDGQIAEVQLFGGYVTGDISAPNNHRPHFESLNKLNPAMSADIHTILSPFQPGSAQTELSISEDRDSNVWQAAMAKAITRARDTGMGLINNELGEPDSRIVALRKADGTYSQTVFIKVKVLDSRMDGYSQASIVLAPESLPEEESLGLDHESITKINIGMKAPAIVGRDREGVLSRAEYKGSTLIDPLAERELSDGRREGLTHLILVGDSVLATRRVWNPETGAIDSVDLVALPVGAAEETLDESAVSVFRYDKSFAVTPRVPGHGSQMAIKDWEEFRADRQSMHAITGVDDKTISSGTDQKRRKGHVVISVGDRGHNITLRDIGATNGTAVITMDRLMNGMGTFMTAEAREAAIKVQDTLAQYPGYWCSEQLSKE